MKNSRACLSNHLYLTYYRWKTRTFREYANYILLPLHAAVGRPVHFPAARPDFRTQIAELYAASAAFAAPTRCTMPWPSPHVAAKSALQVLRTLTAPAAAF